MKTSKLWIPALLAVSLPAAAQNWPWQPYNWGGWYGAANTNSLDLYYTPSARFHAQDPAAAPPDFDDKATGYGVRGQVTVAPNLALSGEYLDNSYDQLDDDISRFSVGAGLVGQGGGIYAEYTGYDFPGNHIDGLGLHARVSVPLARNVALFGDAGYLTAMRDDNGNNFAGPDLSAGLSIALAPQVSLFGEYRYTRLNGPDSLQYEFDDVRTGIRLNFGR